MNKLKESRGTLLDMEKIRSKGNIFSTIIDASARVYRLRKGAVPKIKDYDDPYNSGVITALLEIQEGKYNGLQQFK